MQNKCLCIFFFIIILYACKKEKKSEIQDPKKSEMSIAKTHVTKTSLNSEAVKKTKGWKEYKSLNEFIIRFKNTSPNDALNNALELKILVKNLKDSIRISELKTPAFRARLNILENEALRLVDMTYITAITADQVNQQVDKIFSLYGSINSKINTIYIKKHFDDDLDLVILNSMDSVSKKQTNLKHKKPNKQS
ncbi:Probable lipoprotein precursor [Tenacibaculum maritimum]|nr:Probable lipoprotein precursor [Tenacibaculum maritimum]CAA0173940.1 Probable lipoprotein precursor [Tenacibaculum maritimum]CAA0175740.1 Probable lipoprotein precursor [Tenacibaculum maritimum]